MRRVVLGLALGLMTFVRPVLALDYFVDASTGADSNDGLSWASPKATIGAALITADGSPGSDIVNVAEGSYSELLTMPPETAMQGGFPSGGGARDPERHPTIVDGRGAGPVIAFGAGTDGSSIDGLTVRGGWTDRTDEAGGIAIRDAAPLITNCVIEGNEGRDAGGVSVYVLGGALPRIDGCFLLRNAARSRGGAMFVRSSASTAAASVAVLTNSVVEGNIGAPSDFGLAGAVMLCGSARVENVLFRRNVGDGLSMGCNGQPGQPGSIGLQQAFNCEFSGNTRAGASVQCSADEAALENCTFSANQVAPIVSIFCGIGVSSATVRHAIAWPGGLREGYVSGCICSVFNSVSAGGWRGQPDVLDVDPLFVAGPGGDYYLSQLAAGQAAESPAVDVGVVTAASVALDARSTRTDSVGDAGMVDLGVHYRPFTTLTLLRSQLPTSLVAISTFPALPVTDAPGVLSDSTLPLLFYSIETVDNEIHVSKDLVNDTLRFAF